MRLDYLDIYVKAKITELDQKQKKFINDVELKLTKQRDTEIHKDEKQIHDKVIKRVLKRLNDRNNYIKLKNLKDLISKLAKLYKEQKKNLNSLIDDLNKDIETKESEYTKSLDNLINIYNKTKNIKNIKTKQEAISEKEKAAAEKKTKAEM